MRFHLDSVAVERSIQVLAAYVNRGDVGIPGFDRSRFVVELESTGKAGLMTLLAPQQGVPSATMSLYQTFLSHLREKVPEVVVLLGLRANAQPLGEVYQLNGRGTALEDI
jgi:hypothetical protein